MLWRVLFLILGILLGLIFAANVVFYGVNLKDPFFLPNAFSAIIILVCWLFFEKFQGWVRQIFRILAILSWLWALVAIGLAALLITASFPRQGPFEPKVQLPEVSPQAELVYDEYLKVNRQFSAHVSRQLNTLLKQFKTGAETPPPTEDVDAVRDKVDAYLLFFQENQISIPRDFWTLEAELPSFNQLETAVRFRLATLASHAPETGVDQTCAGYEQLWWILRQHTLASSGISGSLLCYRLAEILITAFLEQPQWMKDCNREVLAGLVEDVMRELDDNLKRSFAVDFVISNRNLEMVHQEGRIFEESLFDLSHYSGKVFGLSWILKRVAHGPLYDHQKWLFEVDRIFAETLIPSCNRPYYLLNELPEQPSGLAASWSLMRAPARFVMDTAQPRFREYVEKKERAKSLLTAFRYLLTQAEATEMEEPPTDNLTGKPFLVMHDSARTRIKSTVKDLPAVDLALRTQQSLL